MQLDFLVKRKGLDPTAETSLHALRDLMGQDVRAVEHGTLWRFDVEGEARGHDLKREIARAACRAGRYVNANRDVFFWLDEASLEAARDPGTWGIDLWICDGDGRDDVARVYFETQLRRDVRRLRRGMLYRLWIPASDAATARQRAEGLARTRSRHEGLLMNPHSQSLEILTVGSVEEERA